MKEHFVIDPLIGKRQQLLLATQLCRMVLKVCFTLLRSAISMCGSFADHTPRSTTSLLLAAMRASFEMLEEVETAASDVEVERPASLRGQDSRITFEMLWILRKENQKLKNRCSVQDIFSSPLRVFTKPYPCILPPKPCTRQLSLLLL